MDWLSWVSQLGYTQLCVVHGTVSLRGKKDGEGELQLWYGAMFNDYMPVGQRGMKRE